MPKLVHQVRRKKIVSKFHRPFPPSSPASSSGLVRSAGARRVGVPVFMGRVSPVLDTCTQMVLLGPDRQEKTAPQKIPVECISIFERATHLRRLGINVIICGAVSDALYTILNEKGIEVVCGITGDINDVIDAYRRGALGEPGFRMPGFE